MPLIRNLCLCLILILNLTLCLPGLAATTEPSPEASPGLGELGSRLGMLNDFVEKSQKRLQQLENLSVPQKDYLRLSQQLQTLRDRTKTLGRPETWYEDRLGRVRNSYVKLKNSLDDLQEQMARQQTELESINASLDQESAFWRDWRKKPQNKGAQLPAATLTRISAQLNQLEESVQAIAPDILRLQERSSSLQQEVIHELEGLDQVLKTQRKSTFQQTTPMLFSPEFHSELRANSWPNIREGWTDILQLDTHYFKQQSWVFALMLLGLCLIPWGIFRYRQHLKNTENCLFVYLHPFATAIFVAVLIGTNLLPAPPALVRFVLNGAGGVAVIILLEKLIASRKHYYLLVLATFFYIVTTGLRLTNLPLPLYRLAITALCVGLLVILFSQLRKAATERNFVYLLRLFMGLLLITLLAQFAGYTNLSHWLLRAGFESGFLLLFAAIILRLGQGAISLFLHHPRLIQKSFFQNFASELALRLQFILKVCVAIYCLLHLLPLWHLYVSSDEAWSSLGELALEIGPLRISLTMVFLATVASYLAIQVSWLVQALVEAQMSSGKEIDRGVRDAIKKLIHYGIITFGFLGVLSLLGMSVQNFVVVLGALGVGIGFGLQDIINNFLSGLILLFERPIKVGDLIVVNDEWGTISKIGLRSTVVKTIEHAEIIVPNSQLIAEKVTNWTHSSSMARLKVPVGVAYGSDVPLVMKILSEIATNHPENNKAQESAILFMGFGASSLDFEIRMYINDINKSFRIRSEVLQQIDSRFREAKVEIPFPQRDLHLRSVDDNLLQTLKAKEDLKTP
ncbi:MAG: mechanosensitive ion channel [Deltaproteobacteria bacterium]|nr:mechanosensitive ion channel [Deltaproteobacteria bacterium]NCP03118.1 mechanosensitive ion channel [Deltaproteobacteria bacterium]NCP77894.1 mechanosensitive ion channel [Desulfuromonadales bacterium]